MSYHSPLIRTSVSLDQGTLDTLAELAQRWSVSKAEVMRRSIRKLKEEADNDDRAPTPLQALDWLQDGA
ncbi:MAG: CopG family transcriptional regulator, partial [Verrucomicrobiaceae bacterium]